MHGNIHFKNMCIGWWPCIVAVYIFIHPFSVVQAWLENNRTSQAARTNQFWVLNVFQAILFGPEQTICFYKGICFTKHLQSWTPSLEDKWRWIHAGFEHSPWAQCWQHISAGDFRGASSSRSWFIQQLISMKKITIKAAEYKAHISEADFSCGLPVC